MFCLCVWMCVALLVLGVGFLGFSALSVTFLASVLYTCTCISIYMYMGVLGLMHVHVCMHAFWVLVYLQFWGSHSPNYCSFCVSVCRSRQVWRRWYLPASRQAPKDKKVGFVNYMYM